MRRALEALLGNEEESAARIPQSHEFQNEANTLDSPHLSNPETSVSDCKHCSSAIPTDPCTAPGREIQPIVYTPSDDDAIETVRKGEIIESSATAESGTKKSDRGNDDGNDAWMKFGIAALGVVVGGVVLSMQSGENEDGNSDTRKDHRNASTVEIEELSDEEWTSVESSQRGK